jgi:hypothetical protein
MMANASCCSFNEHVITSALLSALRVNSLADDTRSTLGCAEDLADRFSKLLRQTLRHAHLMAIVNTQMRNEKCVTA